MGEIGEFFGFFVTIGNFFIDFAKQVWKVMEQIGEFFEKTFDGFFTFMENFHNVIVASLILVFIMILGWPLVVIGTGGICIPSFIFMVLVTVFSTIIATLIYVIVTIIAILFASVDCLFQGHLQPYFRRVHACREIDTNWFDLPYAHAKNGFDTKKIAGLCVSCLHPCRGGSVPKRTEIGNQICVSARNTFLKPYTPCAALMNVFRKKYIMNYQVETEIFSHVKQLHLAIAICKYFEYIDERYGNLAVHIGAKAFPLEPDLKARTHGMSFAEAYLQSPEFQTFLLTMLSFGITFGILFLITLYYMLKP